jgi:hypothetical protein
MNSDEPTCPLCRHTMYFKGLHKISKKWEEERFDKMNEDAFSTAFDEIFNEDEDSDYSDSGSESESEYESDWETASEDEEDPRPVRSSTHSVPSSEFGNGSYLLYNIMQLQSAYQRALKMGVDIPQFLEDDNYMFYIIDKTDTKHYCKQDDTMLFVSKYAPLGNKIDKNKILM